MLSELCKGDNSHYDRMTAVVAAARSGNQLLLRLALEFNDRHGIGLRSEPPKDDAAIPMRRVKNA